MFFVCWRIIRKNDIWNRVIYCVRIYQCEHLLVDQSTNLIFVFGDDLTRNESRSDHLSFYHLSLQLHSLFLLYFLSFLFLLFHLLSIHYQILFLFFILLLFRYPELYDILWLFETFKQIRNFFIVLLPLVERSFHMLTYHPID